MSIAYSFPPIAQFDAKILILGSMPGKASIEANQYYAHPRNAFWKIMQVLLDQSCEDYQQCQSLLLEHRIALWDVMQSCYRPGSLDSNIDNTSIVPNDFTGFFQKHLKIKWVYFNGAKAEGVFKRLVSPKLKSFGAELKYQRLPSTSPAHASASFTQKLDAWRVILPITS